MKLNEKQLLVNDLERQIMDLTVKLAKARAKNRWGDLERKQTRDELAKTLSILKATLDAGVEGLLVLDRGGHIVSFNQEFLNIWNIPQTFMETGNEDAAVNFLLGQLKDPDGFMREMKALYVDPERYGDDVLFLKNGQIIEVHSRPQYIEEQIVGRVWRFRDVTRDYRQQNRLERANQELNTQLAELSKELSKLTQQFDREVSGKIQMEKENLQQKAMIDALLDGIAVMDDRFRCQFANRAFARMFGYDGGEELLGMSWEDLYDPETVSFFKSEVLPLLLEKGTFLGEARGKRRDGSLIDQQLSLRLLPEGTVVWICRDITEQRKVETSLQLSDERFRHLYDDMPLMHFMIDPEGTIIAVNQFGAAQLGYQVEELVGHSVSQVIDEKDHPVWQKQLEQIARANGGVSHWEIRKLRRDGTMIWVEEFARVIQVSPQVRRILLVCQDITERKKMEMVLRESKERLRTLTERIPNGICVVNTNLKFLYYNLAFCRMLGYKPEEMRERKLSDMFELEDRVRAASQLHGVLNGEVEFTDEYHILDRNQQSIPVEISSRRIYFDGQPALLSVFRDLTERKQHEEALRRSEHKYRQLVETVQEGIVVLDQAWVIRFVNPHTRRLLGGQEADILGRPLLHFVERADRERVQNYLKSSEARLKDGGDFQFRRLDSQPIYVNLQTSPLTDAGGESMGVLAVLIDITERKQAQQELKKHKENLEEMVRRRTSILKDKNDKLYAEIRQRRRTEQELMRSREELRQLSAHLESAREEERKWIAREIHDELGQQLSALKMNVNWLEKQFPKDAAQLWEKTRAMSDIISTTIQKVREISQKLRPSILDNLGFTAAISWQAGEFEKNSGIRCDVNIESDDIVLEDERSSALFRIFQEALTNIFRHSKASRVYIELSKDAQNVYLTIEDNGIGISDEKIQGSNSFGLLGIRERVLFLNGEVSIKGVKGEGTRISVRVPLQKSKGEQK